MCVYLLALLNLNLKEIAHDGSIHHAQVDEIEDLVLLVRLLVAPQLLVHHVRDLLLEALIVHELFCLCGVYDTNITY